jgi:glycosyltransferase involved in cell wall biosynthesis
MNERRSVESKQATSLPSISVAMATYNGAHYIQEQLDSIASQTLKPLELVITDDGSTDATAEIVRAFAQTAPFTVKFFENSTRLKYADNFLRASSLCECELIAFCDQDDIWLPNKLNRIITYFEDAEVLLAMHAAETLLLSGERGAHYPEFRETRVYKQGECDLFWNRPGFAMVFRRKLLELTDNSLRPRKLYGHDHWVFFLAASAGWIATTTEVLSLYRQHQSNVYGAPERKSILKKLSIGAETPNYEEVAEGELACASALYSALPGCPPAWAESFTRAAVALERRSKLHRLRGNFYAMDSSFFLRTKIFVQFLISGAYLPDASRTRLGLKAAWKDLSIGLVGLYKLQKS